MRIKLKLGLFALLFCLGFLSNAEAGLVATYVKTLGQTNTGDIPLKGTGFRQIVTDADGNVYLAVIRGWPWTSLAKIAPDGKVIWETEFGGYSTVSLALADGQLYAIKVTPNEAQLSRLDTASGKIDTGWGFTSTKDKPNTKLARNLESVSTIVPAGPYLFVADTKGNEVRRFDRATATEKPFALRLMVVEPISIAIAKNGNLLVLTAESVLELDPEGKSVHIPLIEGLSAAQAIQVDPNSGYIYIAQGGVPDALVNQICQYDANGKPTGVKLGRGGDFNGKWSPDVFAFSSGNSDFTLDSKGGMWVNNALGQLLHFTAAPEFKNDRILMSTDASSIAVDKQLNVYAGLGQGGLKLSWDNKVLWTCGIRPSGDRSRFPGSPISGWPVYLGYAGTKNPVFFVMHDGNAYALETDSGELVGKGGGPGQNGGLPRLTSSGDTLYMGLGEKDKFAVTQGTHETLADWKNWKPFFSPPANLKAGLLGVSQDKTKVYLYDGKQVYCLDTNGKVLWQQPSVGFSGIYIHPFAILADSIVFLAGADGKLVARDAKTGTELAVIGDKKEGLRPAIGGFSGLAVASKDGKNYLFIAADRQIQVFEITAGE